MNSSSMSHLVQNPGLGLLATVIVVPHCHIHLYMSSLDNPPHLPSLLSSF